MEAPVCDSDLYVIVCHAARDRESIQGNVAPGLGPVGPRELSCDRT